jgi:hypothetical protein
MYLKIENKEELLKIAMDGTIQASHGTFHAGLKDNFN